MTIRTLTMAAVLLGAVATQASTTYTVKKGDSLSRISSRLGVSVDALMRANNLSSPHKIRQGQKLVVPDSSVKELATSRRSSSTTYKVKKGDSDWLIARSHGMSVSDLHAANPGIDWRRLQIGTVLNLKKAAAEAPQPALASAKSGDIVKAEGVILRKGPGTSYGRISNVAAGSSTKVLAKRNGWVKVVVEGSAIGWIPYKAYTQSSMALVAPSAPSSSTTAETLIANASEYKGVRYRWGGTSRSGLDCSGFTVRAFQSIGVKLPRTSIEQSKVGTKVARGELEKGDLVFFRTGRSVRINHVGIYIGDGKFIHASSGSGRVTVSKLSDGYYNKRFATARRVRNFASLEGGQNAVVEAVESAASDSTHVAVE